MGKLDGKVALVTGSGRNIGRATVLKLAGEGADVVVNARSNQEEADIVAEEARAPGSPGRFRCWPTSPARSRWTAWSTWPCPSLAGLTS